MNREDVREDVVEDQRLPRPETLSRGQQADHPVAVLQPR